MELALISFDGIDPRVIYNNRDTLENFDKLLDDSMHGSWRTPGHTIASYTNTLTGRKYNVFNFHWDDQGEDYARHRQTEFEFLWDTMDESMTLLNIPTLYPPEDIDDAMVCGFLTPDSAAKKDLARPMEIQEELNEMEYIHDVHAGDTYAELGGEKMVELMEKMMDKRLEAAKMLMDKYDSDLFYAVWTATDRWFHQCKLHGEDIMPLYEKADEILGELLKTIPDDVPAIYFSDHGFAHFDGDDGVHKGHMYDGWYAIKNAPTQKFRDDHKSIEGLYPTILNFFGYEPGEHTVGTALFHTEEQQEEVKARLQDLGYLE